MLFDLSSSNACPTLGAVNLRAAAKGTQQFQQVALAAISAVMAVDLEADR
jgi:hypothetical protein